MDQQKIAQQYMDAGISILPVNLDKTPAVTKWRNVNIEVSEFVSDGIGVKCGKESNNLECLDFDNHFGDAKQTLSNVIKQIKHLYDKYKFPIQSTQNGGYHLLYRCSTINGNQKLASKPKLINGQWKPDAIIETRGEGGYFLAHPTNGYVVVRNDIFNIPTISPNDRDEIINVCKSFNEWSEPVKVSQFEDKERPGDFFNSQPEAKQYVVDALRNSGWIQLNTYAWQRPDKKKGISATLGKVADNIFYNFSSNAHPFNENTGYTPFQVVALLKYNGNFQECAKWIKEKYSLNNVNDYHKAPVKQNDKQDEVDYGNILADCFVDTDVVVDKPPVVMEINHSDLVSDYHRLMTLGNFSAITGKSKSKKTFILKKLIATLGINSSDVQNKFRANLPENKTSILHFDTEQGHYDVWKTAHDIQRLGGGIMPHVATFRLRDKTPKERLNIIEYAVEKFRDSTGVIMIDGIADLVQSINSEEESNSILYLFMKWTEIYNIHICCVIHQNKGNDFATGWLGTQILKKAELVMAVEKDKEDSTFSNVTCDVIRGAKEFPPFSFMIDSDGDPVISTKYKSGF